MEKPIFRLPQIFVTANWCAIFLKLLGKMSDLLTDPVERIRLGFHEFSHRFRQFRTSKNIQIEIGRQLTFILFQT